MYVCLYMYMCVVVCACVCMWIVCSNVCVCVYVYACMSCMLYRYVCRYVDSPAPNLRHVGPHERYCPLVFENLIWIYRVGTGTVLDNAT